ncbi:MAG: MBL fold metallo-hydrolase [Actinobacteria bacterium]|nr:MBL fold metallo-hydrolase [Actinomycetota bacterium]
MRLRIVGCSPAWHNPGGAQSGYLVEAGGRKVLLDCGPGVLARLREEEAWPHVDAIVVTHFHLDHWGDLVPWAFGGMYGAGHEVPAPELWLPAGGTDTLRTLDPVLYSGAILDHFTVHEYAEVAPFVVAGLTLVALRMTHYGITSFGLRVTNGTRSLAYSGDSAPSPALAELARDADLFLCEATLARPEEGIRGHLTAEEAIEAYEESGARRLLVVHRPDELPLPDGIERAHDGQELEV